GPGGSREGRRPRRSRAVAGRRHRRGAARRAGRGRRAVPGPARAAGPPRAGPPRIPAGDAGASGAAGPAGRRRGAAADRAGAGRRAARQVTRAHPERPARLAAGEYPQQTETELAASAVSLLPRGAAELAHDCSCLDWPGPCRHVSALLYVLVEAVDDRPALLLT